MRKILSFILAVTLLFSVTTISHASSSLIGQDLITVDGYEFQVAKSVDDVKLTYQENGTEYVATLDKIENKVYFDVKEISQRSFPSSEDSIADLRFEVNGNYTEEDGFSDLKLVHYNPDSDVDLVLALDTDGQEISVEFLAGQDSIGSDTYFSDSYLENGASIQPYTLPFIIPAGIGLTEKIIAALLAIGAAILIGQVAYVLADEAYQGIKKQNEYSYFLAVLQNGAVYVGPGASTNTARGQMVLNSSTKGVMAVSDSMARGLAGSSALGGLLNSTPEIHGATGGYWYHYHCKNYMNAHCWFY